jgi:hypothetical protein
MGPNVPSNVMLLAMLFGLIISTPPQSPAPCPVTPTVREAPPRDPNADPFGPGPWYVNADRTLWAWAGSETGTWVSGRGGNKVMWIRPRGTRLEVSGHRLDGNAKPLKASIPGGYFFTFQVTGLYFPAPGCWKVTAHAGASKIRFRTEVKTPPAQ